MIGGQERGAAPGRLHIHVPFRLLESTLPFLLEERLQPEIAFQGPDLDLASFGALREAGSRLADAQLSVTVHAPFMDLNPGALEPLVFAATRRRFEQSVDAAAALGARLIVFHPGYDPWKYGKQDHLWLEQNLLFWPPLLKRAADAGCKLALENIFEISPEPLATLLDTVDSPLLGHCFDVGHWRLFSKVSLGEWFARLGSRLVHLHLHDNHGERDDHLPVGDGSIDFPYLVSLVGALAKPPTMTLEAHNRSDLLRSLGATLRCFSPQVTPDTVE